MRRSTTAVLATVAVAVAVVAGGLVLFRAQGVRVGDCVSQNGGKLESCDARKNQLRIVAVGIVGCDAANNMSVVVKHRQSYCAMPTKSGTKTVVNEGDCVKKSTVAGTASLVKAACTDTAAHKVMKKVTESTNKADCPATAPTALVNRTSKYVLCFKA
jgi:hypothetical protein